MGRKKKIDIEQYDPILPDESILAVGIDSIKLILGGLEVQGNYDYMNDRGVFNFILGYGWEHNSIKDIEQFIQAEISKKLCPVN